MSASGNRPASVSPPPRPRTSTQWQTTTAPPPPPPPAQPLSPQPPLTNSRQQHATNTTTANGDNDISLRQILARYKDDPELLKHILKAKVEEDKKQTTVDTIKVEQARIHLRELDIELLREQNKLTSGYYDKDPQQHPPALPSSTSLHPPATAAPTGIGNGSSSSSNGSSGYALAAPSTEPTAGTPYYGLAPVQQQVLARITGESTANANSNHYSHNTNNHAGNNHHSYQQHPVIENGHATDSSTLPPPAPPRSPVAYPHSAHPLCPPSEPHPYRNNSSSSSSTWNYRQRFYPRNNAHQPTTPISPGIGDTRDHPPSLPLPPHQQQQQQQQHQDIQKKRGRSSTNTDGGENESITHDQVMEALKAKIQRGNNDRSKRARIPSPRSSKPILPPIDTSVGRIPSSSSSIPSVTATAPLPSTTSPTNTTTTTTDQESKQQQSIRPTTSDTSSSSTVATEPTSTKS